MSAISIDDVFLAGLALVREAGLPASGKDVAVLAAYRVFAKHAAGKEDNPQFAEQGPRYAKQLILQAYASDY